jgi:tyrosine-protein kinase Etk/Wzc
VLGVLMGLFAGVVVVLLRWMLSGKLQSDRQVRRALGQRPLWAAIPHEDLRAGKTLPWGRPSAFVEAFRHLRTSIYCDGGETDKTDKVVVVTSPSAGDGKTLCTISLAAALATDGKRVLVVEADMRKPSLAALLPVSHRGDLAELLTGAQSWFDVVTTVPVGSRAFDVIAAHDVRPDSSELLSSARFTDVLDYARARYDFVLIDSPPFPLLSDALILARQAGRLISVLRLGNTPRHAAERHLQGLAVIGARHGVIVNDADADAAADAYYQASASARTHRPELSKAERASAPAV